MGQSSWNIGAFRSLPDYDSIMMDPDTGIPYLVERDEDGWWIARVPELPGCVSQGSSFKEACENIREAIHAVLQVLKEDEPERYARISIAAQANIRAEHAAATVPSARWPSEPRMHSSTASFRVVDQKRSGSESVAMVRN